MPEVSRIRFNCTHKSQIAKIIEQEFPGRKFAGEYLGTGCYEARLLEDGVLYWQVGHEPRMRPRVIAGPPLGPGEWVS